MRLGERVMRLVTSRWILLPLLGVAAIFTVAFLGIGGTQHEVTVRFANATGLVAGNEVRVAGIIAGGVDTVEAVNDPGTGEQYAQVTLHLDPEHWPLHQGTTFAVRPKGVLSNVYVAMDPGSPNAATLDASHVFGLDQTSSPVQLDQFSNIFDRNVTESLRTQIQEGVLVLGNNGAQDLNRVLQEANPLTSDLEPVTAVLAERSPQLDRLNFEFDTISGELAREDANLRGLINNGDATLAAIATRETQLQGTLDHAANVLGDLDAGLQGEQSNLAAIFQKGPAALAKAQAMAQTLSPLINAVNPHISSLDTLLNEFITATGFPANVDTLRVDGSTPPPGYSAIGCGGTPENPC